MQLRFAPYTHYTANNLPWGGVWVRGWTRFGQEADITIGLGLVEIGGVNWNLHNDVSSESNSAFAAALGSTDGNGPLHA